jgi:hypothetical protein
MVPCFSNSLSRTILYFNFSVPMCKITHYRFCTETTRQPPDDKFDICANFKKLLSESQHAALDGFMPAVRVRDHHKCKLWSFPFPTSSAKVMVTVDSWDWAQTEVVHVEEVLLGGTCVPDKSVSRVRRHPEGQSIVEM